MADFIDQINSVRTNFGQTLSLINKIVAGPKTIIDVGVAFGTPELYNAFPNSEIILVEPLEEFIPHMDKIQKTRKNVHKIIAAAGPNDGEMEMSVTWDKTGSSLVSLRNTKKRNVATVRLDTICKKIRTAPTYVIKVDVQGFELKVIEGCEGILPDILAIVLEVSFWGDDEIGIPDLFEVIAYMKRIGFVAYDIVGGHNRPLDFARAQADIVFVKEDGQLRKERRWATPEQVLKFKEAKKERKIYESIVE